MSRVYTQAEIDTYAEAVLKGEFGENGKRLRSTISEDAAQGTYERIMARVAELLLTNVEESPPDEGSGSSSEIILESIKVLLGLSTDNHDFDRNLIIFINSAIFSLRQLGIGPLDKPYTITPENAETATYQDYLGEAFVKETSDVKTYIYFKVFLSFDPPTNASTLKVITDALKEAEWRLTANVELPSLNGKEEIQNGANYVPVPV